jgi:phosphoribosylaminoimidazole carboxylase
MILAQARGCAAAAAAGRNNKPPPPRTAAGAGPRQQHLLILSQQQPQHRPMASRPSATAHAAHTTNGDPTISVSPSGHPRTAVLGVLGGGQLGRMMALAAANLGVTMRCLDPTPGAPAAVAARQTVGSFRDPEAVAAFCAGGVDVLTVEIEHVDADALAAAAARSGADVEPTPATVALIQDKYAQKEHFRQCGVPVAEQVDVPDAPALADAAKRLGYPFMLKAKRLAYDGKGNFVVKSPEDLAKGADALGGFSGMLSDGEGGKAEAGGLYAERWAPFVKELAVMVVRDRSGKTVAYPVTETVHRDSILWVTESPADVPEALRSKAAEVARKAVGALDGAGIFGVEMFLLPDGSLLLNEVAPRPHNSGHYTMDACATSQFENHVRAVLGWPLGDASLIGRKGGDGGSSTSSNNGTGSSTTSNDGTTAIMLNLVGEADGAEGARIAHAKMAAAYATPGCSVHWYGKDDGAAGGAADRMRKGRKVGHINVVGSTRQEARDRLRAIDGAAAAALTAAAAATSSGEAAGDGHKTPLVGIIMGSDSDLPTMSAAAQALDEFGIPYEVTIVSAHRTPDRMLEYARSAPSRGLRAIVAGAGGAAHLPGMVAALTPLPVVGVPVTPAGAHLDGVDALLSICQMPKGVPVATVAIGNAANAGLLAARIVASADPALLQRMVEYQAGMRDVVMDKAERLERDGWKAYLGKK